MRKQREGLVTVLESMMKIYQNSHRLVLARHQFRPVPFIFKYEPKFMPLIDYHDLQVVHLRPCQLSHNVNRYLLEVKMGQLTGLQQAQQRQLDMKPSRLTTEELIQQTRINYDLSKLQQRIHELDLTLQLRNKEVQYLTKQLASNKEDHSLRIKQLQAETISLKRQLAEARVNHVRSSREQSDKHEKALEALRKEYEVQSKQSSSQWQTKYEEIAQAQRMQLGILKQQYQGYIQLEKQEVEICKNISQQHSHSYHLTVSQLQQDKHALILARKEAEAKTKLYQDALEAAKLQFQSQTAAKDQIIARLKAEIEAQRLKHQFLEQKLELYNKKQQENHSNCLKIQQLQQINNQLIDDNQRIRTMLRQKEEEILQELKQHQQIPHKQIEVQQFQCNHAGLIHQFETSLRLKDKQIQQLRAIIEEWTKTIGFDRPLSQRLSQLAEICQNTINLNDNWLKKLKGKKQVKLGKISRFIN